jgi:hypothetical protein
MAAARANVEASVGVAKVGAVPAAGASLGVASDADTLLRTILFVVMFLAVWISFHPFSSLAEPPRTARQIGEFGRRHGVAPCVGAAVDFLTGARMRAPH